MGTTVLIILFAVVFYAIHKERERRDSLEELLDRLSMRVGALERNETKQTGIVQKISAEIMKLKKKLEAPALCAVGASGTKGVAAVIGTSGPARESSVEPRRVTISALGKNDAAKLHEEKKEMPVQTVQKLQPMQPLQVRPEPLQPQVRKEAPAAKPEMPKAASGEEPSRSREEQAEKTFSRPEIASVGPEKRDAPTTGSQPGSFHDLREEQRQKSAAAALRESAEKSLSVKSYAAPARCYSNPIRVTPGVPPAGEAESAQKSITRAETVCPSQTRKHYTEKASRFEMAYAGTCLNYVGLVFLITGILTYLTVQLSSSLPNGVLQCIAGLSLGLTMILTGYYLNHRNMQKFAHIVVAGGFCIMFFTVCATYFHFHLIREWLLFLSIFVIVAASGISIFRLDSKFIGNSMLVTVFLAPALMKFGFSSVGTISLYLIAVNLGIAYVAYHKKWDYYLIVSFVSTYLLYFCSFHFTQPVHALGFLIVMYLIYLFSNNVLHFVRKTSSGFHMALSYINPTVFAVVSYFLLIKMANLWATIVYLMLAVIHLVLTVRARRLEERDALFTDIVNNHLILGLLFLTASISFVTYFSNATAFFPVVTALWFIEAYVLFVISFHLRGLERILRRYSYFAMTLASAQLFYVIPTMGQSLSALAIYLMACLSYCVYFNAIYQRRQIVGSEEKSAMTVSLIAAIGVVTYIIYRFSLETLWIPVLCGLFSHLLLYVSMRFNALYSTILRRFSFAYMALFTCQLVLMKVNSSHTALVSTEFLMLLISWVLYVGYFAFLRAYRAAAGEEVRFAMTFSLVASFALLTYLVHEAVTVRLYLPIAYGALSLCALFVSNTFLKEHAQLMRRFSYAWMVLFTCFQILLLNVAGAFKIPSQQFVLSMLSLVMYTTYFAIFYRLRSDATEEEKYARTLSLLGAVVMAIHIIYSSFVGTLYLPLVSGILAHMALQVSLRLMPEYSKLWRRLSFLLMAFVAYSLFFALPISPGMKMTVVSAKFILYFFSSTLYFTYFLALYRHRDAFGSEERYYMALTALSSLVIAGYLLITLSSGVLYLKVCATLLSAAVLFVSLRYFEIMIDYHKLAFLGLTGVTLSILFSGFMIAQAPLFLNIRFGAMMLIILIHLLCYVMLRRNEDRIPAADRWTIGAIPYMIIIIAMKAFLLEMPGSGSTVIWSLMALAMLYYSTRNSEGDVFRLLSAPMSLKGLSSYSSAGTSRENVTALSYLMFFVTFLKSVVFDANFFIKAGRIDIPAPGTLNPGDVLSMLILTIVYICAARLVWKSYETRNLLVALGLFIFSFQSSFVLYKLWGVWDYFQTILSAYWSIIAFAFITYGIYRELKVFRLFGLILISATIMKIGYVDLWVLSYNNRVITFTILGLIMMVTSFLYQKNRNTIAEKSTPGSLAVEPA